jgi:hypothetical protein
LTLLKVLQNTTKKEKLITDLQLAQSTELTTSFQSILWLIIYTKQMTWVGGFENSNIIIGKETEK